MVDIKERVRYYMNIKQMNNNQLAKAADLNPSVISSLFTRSGEPEITTLSAICDGLNITLSEFFAEGDMFELTKEQRDILYIFGQLSNENQELATKLMKALISK